MRPEVNALIQLGPLPMSTDAGVAELKQIEAALHALKPPLSSQEASSLLPLFGPDDCFGLAWTMLNLVETAPSLSLPAEHLDENEWVKRIRKRESK